MKTARVLLLPLLFLGLVGCGGPDASTLTHGHASLDGSGIHWNVQIPLVIDGVRYSPSEVATEYDGQPLRFFIDKEAQAGGFAYAFTSEETERAFLRLWEPAHPKDLEARDVRATSLSDSIFYENADAGGAQFVLPEHTAIADLHYANCILWWCANWNDRISSATPSRTNRYTVLYDLINYGSTNTRPSLRLSNGTVFVNLSQVGYNDITSSIGYEY